MMGTEFFSFFKAYVGVLSSGESLLYPQVALSSAGYAVLNLHDNGQISYNVSSCIDIKKKVFILKCIQFTDWFLNIKLRVYMMLLYRCKTVTK